MIRRITGSAATASLLALLGACVELPDGDASGKGEHGEAVVAAATAPAPSPAVTRTAGAPMPPVKETSVPAEPAKVFAAECGACHMPYPAALLPARSWQAIMAGLPDHFGENASLDPDTTTQIGDYLLANAADAKGRRSGVLRGLAAGDVPLRITDTPWWKRQHDEVSAAAFKRASVKSASNCVACHGAGAVRGVFEDD